MASNRSLPATRSAALRAVLTLPATLGLIVPLLLAVGDPWRRSTEVPSVAVGVILVGGGLLTIYQTVREFYVAGRGTLAPWDPPRHLVTTGLFALCRNPMYLGVLAVVAGVAMASRSPILGIYLVTVALAFQLRVTRYEEPWAAATFPERWPPYRDAVPRWIPRLRQRDLRL